MKVLCIQAPRIPAGDAETYLKGVLKKYAEDEFQMIVLPEKWITNSLEEKDPVFQALINAFREASDKYSCDVIPGSFSLERNGKLYNSSPFIHGGKVIGYQDKISLFKGEIGKYSSGDRIRLFNSCSLKISIAVCYDLDFPYFAKMVAGDGGSLIVNPSLITSEFKEMWHIYVKGRSLETRLPVISINSLSDPFLGGSIVTRMRPRNGGIFLEEELLGTNESRIVETNPEDMREYIDSRQAEDPGIYNLKKR